MNLGTLAPDPLSMMRNPNQITSIILEEFQRFEWTINKKLDFNWQIFLFLILFTHIFFISSLKISIFSNTSKNNP